MKIKEKTKRIKYLRALEKIAKRAINSLKRKDFEKDRFELSLKSWAKLFEKIEPVYLDQSYSKELQSFVNACLEGKSSQIELINKANKLQQLKNNKNYKKLKHKNELKDF